MPLHSHGQRLSLAWPLALAYLGLVVYASLFPFTGWRYQGIAPWAFLVSPWPRYWTGFDVAINLAGYVPLGLLITLALLRSGVGSRAVFWGAGAAALVSLAMETTQGYLMERVPSQVDWGLNAIGALLGALLALLLLRWRVLGPWQSFRERWLVSGGGQGALLLLMAWPLAVLYPSSVAFGLGQGWRRLELYLHDALADSLLQIWWPQVAAAPAISPLTEALAVALSLWAPTLLGYAVLRTLGQRMVFLLCFAGMACAAAGLSAALTYGPVHAWAWLTPPAILGLVLAAIMAVLSVPLGHRAAAVSSVLAWGLALGLLNRAPDTPYFAQSLQIWEQGRFLRFHGLSQWLGWLWPYAALGVGLQLALRRQVGHYNPRP
jgi:VanZ family protein